MLLKVVHTFNNMYLRTLKTFYQQLWPTGFWSCSSCSCCNSPCPLFSHKCVYYMKIAIMLIITKYSQYISIYVVILIVQIVGIGCPWTFNASLAFIQIISVVGFVCCCESLCVNLQVLVKGWKKLPVDDDEEPALLVVRKISIHS